jgi:large subunit ribosomal protein L23
MLKDEYDIVKKMLVTEKNVYMSQYNKYVFEVDKSANKVQVAKAIEKIFNVKVKSVNTLRSKEENKRFGVRSARKKASKKAIVTLAEGHSINLLD